MEIKRLTVYSKNLVKKFGMALALSAVFIGAAAPAAQTQSAPQDPVKSYASLIQAIDTLGDQSKQIEKNIHTRDVLGLPTNTAEITQMRAQLKKSIAEEAPHIVLAPGLSGPNIQSLLDSFKAKVGPLPDYLAEVDGYTRFVPACQAALTTATRAKGTQAARDVADCVASKTGVDEKAIAVPQQAQPVEPEISVTEPAKGMLEKIDGKTAAMGSGVAALGLLGIFGIGRIRRKPIDAYVPVTSGGPEPAPEPAKEKEPFQIRHKPKLDQSKQDDTAYTSPPKKFSI